MKILIVENTTPESRGGDQDKWKEEAEQAYGLAVFDEFDLVIGLDENGECPVIHNQSGIELVEAEVVMT